MSRKARKNRIEFTVRVILGMQILVFSGSLSVTKKKFWKAIGVMALFVVGLFAGQPHLVWLVSSAMVGLGHGLAASAVA